MNAQRLRQSILLAVGLAHLGCEPARGAHDQSVPPIEPIEPPGAPIEPPAALSGETIPLPNKPYCGGCQEAVSCEAPIAEMPTQHYPAPYERCRINASFDVEVTDHARGTEHQTCCYKQLYMHPKGRPLRHEDLAIVPELEPSAHALADRFVEIARIEHSSVASFADLSLSLLAHGAPIELVEGAHRAALDEIGHAQAALVIASTLDGVTRKAGAMAIPQADRSFSAMVRATVIDGCFGEVIGALEAEAERSEDPMIEAFFRRVAIEEAGHAVLAFQILRWALTHDRDAAEAAIAGALASIDATSAARPEVDAVTRPCLAYLIAA